MIEAVVAGKGSDQRALVETSLVPIAIVNGQDDLGRNSSPAYSYGITYALRVRLQAIFDVERGSVVGTAELPR
jgi:hypothetical protein